MRAWQLERWSIDSLRIADRPRPSAGPGQVLLRMKAASLNYRDLVVPRRGYGPQTGDLPLVPVSDGVGEVVEAGPGVTGISVGERICPFFFDRGKSRAGRRKA